MKNSSCINQLDQICQRTFANNSKTLGQLFQSDKLDFNSINLNELSRRLISSESSKNLLHYIRTWIYRNTPVKPFKHADSPEYLNLSCPKTKAAIPQSSHSENWIFQFLVDSLRSISFRQKSVQQTNLKNLERWFEETTMIRKDKGRHNSRDDVSAAIEHMSKKQSRKSSTADEEDEFINKPFRNFEAFKRLKEYSRRTFQSQPKLLLKGGQKEDLIRSANYSKYKSQTPNNQQNPFYGGRRKQKTSSNFGEGEPRIDLIMAEAQKRFLLSSHRKLRESREQQEIEERLRQFRRNKERFIQKRQHCAESSNLQEKESLVTVIQANYDEIPNAKFKKIPMSKAQESQEMLKNVNRDSLNSPGEDTPTEEQPNQYNFNIVDCTTGVKCLQVGKQPQIFSAKLTNWIQLGLKAKTSLAKTKLLAQFKEDNTDRQKLEKSLHIKTEIKQLNKEMTPQELFQMSINPKMWHNMEDRFQRQTFKIGFQEKDRRGNMYNFTQSGYNFRGSHHDKENEDVRLQPSQQTLFKGLSSHLSVHNLKAELLKEEAIPPGGVTLMEDPFQKKTSKPQKISKVAKNTLKK